MTTTPKFLDYQNLSLWRSFMTDKKKNVMTPKYKYLRLYGLPVTVFFTVSIKYY